MRIKSKGDGESRYDFEKSTTLTARAIESQFHLERPDSRGQSLSKLLLGPGRKSGNDVQNSNDTFLFSIGIMYDGGWLSFYCYL